MKETVTIKVRSSTRGQLRYLSAVKEDDMTTVLADIVMREFIKLQRKIEKRALKRGTILHASNIDDFRPKSKTKHQ